MLQMPSSIFKVGRNNVIIYWQVLSWDIFIPLFHLEGAELIINNSPQIINWVRIRLARLIEWTAHIQAMPCHLPPDTGYGSWCKFSTGMFCSYLFPHVCLTNWSTFHWILGRIWTADLRIFSHPLCHLSYHALVSIKLWLHWSEFVYLSDYHHLICNYGKTRHGHF